MLTNPSKDVFAPEKGYKRVRWVGDRDWQDFEGIEGQQMQDFERQQLGNEIFAQAAIVHESGGTISAPQQGVHVGNVAASASGTYDDFSTQIYTLKVIEGGGAGTARIQVISDGSDKGADGAGFEIAISALDPLNGTVKYAVGARGVKVAFTDPKVIKNFIEADSWTILANHRSQLPTVNIGASTITPARIAIYIDGRILSVGSEMLSFTPKVSGRDILYVEVIRDIITGDADSAIRASLTNEKAADRERIVARFVNHDTTDEPLPSNALQREIIPAYLWDRATNKVERASGRPIVFNMSDIPGNLSGAALADLDFSEQLKGINAELVDDIVGVSYRISGLRARKSTNASPTGKVLITVEKGKARISGLKILKGAEDDLLLDLALDVVTVFNEAKTFNTGTDVYTLNKAVGANKLPIKDVTVLSAVVEITRSITKGTANGLDELPDQPVSAIVSVVQGMTTFVPTTDYILNGNFVDWSPGGAEPTTGSSYDVTYRFTKSMIPVTDFNLIDSDGDGDFDSVDFSPGGDDPVDGTIFFVTYEYYQPRIDSVFLKTDAAFAVARGTPADFPIAPEIPTQVLGIATITLGPNSSTNIVVTNLDNRRVSMAEIRDMIRRQEDAQRNDAEQGLIDQTKFRETASFKGVFGDAFATDDVADVFFNRLAGAGGVSPGSTVDYDALIDLFELVLTLPVISSTRVLVKDDSLVPSGQLASRFNRDFATLPYSEVLEIDQSNYSEQINVNPFHNFSPPEPQVLLVPDRNEAVDETTSTEDTYWLRKHKKIRRLSEQKLAKLLKHPKRIKSRTVEEVGRLVEERQGVFMKPITVEIRGTRYTPGENNIIVSFDGKLVNLTPINGTLAGTLAGSVKARGSTVDLDNNVITLGGDWEATFTIPPNVPIGVVNVVATGPVSGATSAPFDGELLERDITIFERVIFRIKDPLAQTFGFSAPTCITHIEIPFAARGNNADSPIALELRDVGLPGGFPGLTLFDAVQKKSEQINTGVTSGNSFTFGNPMLQTGNSLRALVLVTDSSDYEVYTATLGHMGLNPPGWITRNPNLRGSEPAGIFLESLNAVNWEAESKTALRYRLYRADFQPESWVYFQRISAVQYSQLFLDVDEVVPEGTSVDWQVSIDGLAVANLAKVWLDIVPFESLDLGQIATTVDVRVKLATTDSRITPYVNFHNWVLEGALYKATGKYVSKAALLLSDITQIKEYVDTQIPVGTTLTWYASNGEDVTDRPIWEEVATLSASVDLGDGFTELTRTLSFDNTIVDKTSKRRLRVRIDMTTSDQSKTPIVRDFAATFI